MFHGEDTAESESPDGLDLDGLDPGAVCRTLDSLDMPDGCDESVLIALQMRGFVEIEWDLKPRHGGLTRARVRCIELTDKGRQLVERLM